MKIYIGRMELKRLHLIALYARLLVLGCLLYAGLGLRGLAIAQTAPTPLSTLGADLEQQVRQLAFGTHAQPHGRVEILLGTLDRRLRLAPCKRVEPFLPAGTRLWGRTRVGLRCVQGPTRWNVYLPLTVKVYGLGLTATRALPAGTVLAATDLHQAEVDLAEETGVALVEGDAVVGRILSRPLNPGRCLRETDLKPNQFFASGDTVRIHALGQGFEIASEGQALGPGLEGRLTRVRTEGGRVVTGMPMATRKLELRL
ncbi:MAG: flagellar basal body P-ring formation chaperone FlgA [Burkholderiaceae bacterium]|nr:flagellar basal body P-ring formation chaperone FlgA [Burkholderiaceae bacterium]